jgi:predicted N-acetyltransferase YhbS
MNSIAVDIADAAELAEVGEFYKTTGYGGGVSQGDVTLTARLDGHLVGAVRLCLESGVVVLRGMQIAPFSQRKGIGRTLLQHCVPFLNKGPAYCVPYEHLTSFYGQVGFIVTPPALLPEFLAKRLARYVATSRQTVAMKRIPE